MAMFLAIAAWEPACLEADVRWGRSLFDARLGTPGAGHGFPISISLLGEDTYNSCKANGGIMQHSSYQKPFQELLVLRIVELGQGRAWVLVQMSAIVRTSFFMMLLATHTEPTHRCDCSCRDPSRFCRLSSPRWPLATSKNPRWRAESRISAVDDVNPA